MKQCVRKCFVELKVTNADLIAWAYDSNQETLDKS